MTDDTTATIQEDIMNVIQLIATSRIIPEAHKLKYIEHIERNGFSERMIEELMKIFTQEEEALEEEIKDEEQLVADLDKVIAEEESKTDEEQARILASLEGFHERNEQDLKHEYEDVDMMFSKAEEELKENSENAEEDAIRAKLGLK